jgi:hypothetical protein
MPHMPEWLIRPPVDKLRGDKIPGDRILGEKMWRRYNG